MSGEIDIPSPARKRLEVLYEKHGLLTADIVVNDAKSKDSPLHKCFNWDVQAAAEAHWRSVARRLIRSVKIEWETEEYTYDVPAYIERPNKENTSDQGYSSIEDIRTDKQLAASAMMNECERMKCIVWRCESIGQMLAVTPKLKRMLQIIKEMEDKLRNV